MHYNPAQKKVISITNILYPEDKRLIPYTGSDKSRLWGDVALFYDDINILNNRKTAIIDDLKQEWRKGNSQPLLDLAFTNPFFQDFITDLSSEDIVCPGGLQIMRHLCREELSSITEESTSTFLRGESLFTKLLRRGHNDLNDLLRQHWEPLFQRVKAAEDLDIGPRATITPEESTFRTGRLAHFSSQFLDVLKTNPFPTPTIQLLVLIGEEIHKAALSDAIKKQLLEINFNGFFIRQIISLILNTGVAWGKEGQDKARDLLEDLFITQASPPLDLEMRKATHRDIDMFISTGFEDLEEYNGEDSQKQKEYLALKTAATYLQEAEIGRNNLLLIAKAFQILATNSGFNKQPFMKDLCTDLAIKYSKDAFFMPLYISLISASTSPHKKALVELLSAPSHQLTPMGNSPRSTPIPILHLDHKISIYRLTTEGVEESGLENGVGFWSLTKVKTTPQHPFFIPTLKAEIIDLCLQQWKNGDIAPHSLSNLPSPLLSEFLQILSTTDTLLSDGGLTSIRTLCRYDVASAANENSLFLKTDAKKKSVFAQVTDQMCHPPLNDFLHTIWGPIFQEISTFHQSELRVIPGFLTHFIPQFLDVLHNNIHTFPPTVTQLLVLAYEEIHLSVLPHDIKRQLMNNNTIYLFAEQIVYLLTKEAFKSKTHYPSSLVKIGHALHNLAGGTPPLRIEELATKVVETYTLENFFQPLCITLVQGSDSAYKEDIVALLESPIHHGPAAA
jgi:hypothetical protein